jgi:hypothetical protein
MSVGCAGCPRGPRVDLLWDNDVASFGRACVGGSTLWGWKRVARHAGCISRRFGAATALFVITNSRIGTCPGSPASKDRGSPSQSWGHTGTHSNPTQQQLPHHTSRQQPFTTTCTEGVNVGARACWEVCVCAHTLGHPRSPLLQSGAEQHPVRPCNCVTAAKTAASVSLGRNCGSSAVR